MATVWTNDSVALTKDLIFGVSVMTPDGWLPISELDEKDLRTVIDACDFNPSNPYAADLTEASQKFNAVKSGE